MNTQQADAAHSLYVLYETLPESVQQGFLKELVQNKYHKLRELVASDSDKQHCPIVFGVMEGAFSIPENFDAPLPDSVLNEFYTERL